jgi:hypothetical protein
MGHEDQWDARFEDVVGEAFSVVGAGFRSETGPRLGEVVARGRSLRRRRMATVAGSVTALAVIGVGGVFASGLGTPARSGSTVSQGAAGAASSTSAAMKTSQTATAGPPVTSQEVVDNLHKLLGPQATFNPARSVPGAMSGPLVADGVIDDGRGKAAFGFDIERRDQVQTQPSDLTCPDKKYVPYDDCSSTKLADGSTLVLLKGYEYSDKRVLTKDWTARFFGPDGQYLEFQEWNSSQGKDAPITRTDPPLGFQQLTALLTARSWQPLLARIPKPQLIVVPPRSGAQPGRDEILSVAAGLLPTGLTEADTTGQKGFVSFNVDDGKGKGQVQIYVAKLPAGAPDSRYDNATTLPDGSKLVVQQTTGSDVVRWSADVLRPDGTRVVVAALNVANQRGTVGAKASRRTPALTLDQIRAIATNPIWQQHNGKQ